MPLIWIQKILIVGLVAPQKALDQVIILSEVSDIEPLIVFYTQTVFLSIKLSTKYSIKQLGVTT